MIIELLIPVIAAEIICGRSIAGELNLGTPEKGNRNLDPIAAK